MNALRPTQLVDRMHNICMQNDKRDIQEQTHSQHEKTNTVLHTFPPSVNKP